MNGLGLIEILELLDLGIFQKPDSPVLIVEEIIH
jgi:hypothetical protein